ncbi:MAG: NADH:flavin oxidoreductase/NADH oxidase [Rhodospirillaceae bacterium]|nr:NADH:flavin oxidoreductase/NADH oxidase [Rhodospirillaceae bacterium]
MAGEDEKRILRRDPDPHLFRPLTLRSVTVKNRIMLSPMCQYSSPDGAANFWHMQHLGARAAGGAGIVCTEATHVEARGRITPYCLGLWNDAQRDALAPIAAFIASQGAVPAIQLGHAGRKASVSRPWEGNQPLSAAAGGWDTIAPSKVRYSERFPIPKAMDGDDIRTVVEAFRSAARRARQAGFKLIEIHAAHGYLFHQFLSPASNARGDAYGGTLENRARLLMEALDAIRSEWPADLPLFVRLSCTDWVQGSWDVAEAIELCRMLKARGDVDLVDCSSGGNDPRQQIPVHPGYQIGFAERVRREAGLATAAVGLIHSPDMAEEIVANGRADIVVLGRTLLADPVWPLRAAKALRAANVKWPVQYERSDIF